MPSALYVCEPTAEKDLTSLAPGEDIEDLYWHPIGSPMRKNLQRYPVVTLHHNHTNCTLVITTKNYCIPCMYFTNSDEEICAHHFDNHTKAE